MALGNISKLISRRPERKIKVFGERNTGTRAVMQMLRAHKGVSLSFPRYKNAELDKLETYVHANLKGFNAEIFRDAIEDIRRGKLSGHSAWKHAAPVVDESYAAQNASVLFLVRDPYSWIAAFYRNPYHARAPLPRTLSAFLEQPWLTVKRENIAPILLSPMELWNAKLRAYRDFAAAAPVPSTVLHFEEFVLESVKTLSHALARFNIPHKGLAEITEPTKKEGKSSAERVEYYRSKAWEDEINHGAARAINELVDWDVAEHFGYKMRAP